MECMHNVIEQAQKWVGFHTRRDYINGTGMGQPNPSVEFGTGMKKKCEKNGMGGYRMRVAPSIIIPMLEPDLGDALIS